MNPYVLSLVGSVLRWLLTVVATWLVAAGIITPESQTQWVAGLVAVLIPLIWGIYQKFFAKQLLDAALTLPAGATVPEAVAKAGQIAGKG